MVMSDDANQVTILSCRIHGEEDTLFAFKGRIEEDLLVDHAQKFYVDERYEMIGDKPLADYKFNTMDELEEVIGDDDCFVTVTHLVITDLLAPRKHGRWEFRKL